jgi:hypothetical protein
MDEEKQGWNYDWISCADHIKFEKGVVGRYQRMAEAAEARKNKDSAVIDADTSPTTIANSGRLPMNVSVLLNPTLIDSRPSGSTSAYMKNAESSAFPDRMTLQLRYLKDDASPSPSREDVELPSTSTGGVLPLADYIVISESNEV